ncbi:glycosyltransferase [Fodinicurvata sp. EGI_FJ10296]|uniref:CgeB family protein n=1 Tax=Fodinicurvata sp. EGI_FJ10296 TaxID=3231908 RepID=UPI0034530A66
MKIVYFTQSLRSCWNHGNAHFLRGMVRALRRSGHCVDVLEPAGSWSLTNLRHDQGDEGLLPFRRAYPDLEPVSYDDGADPVLFADAADLVIVHEWTDPAVIARLVRLRREGGRFLLLYHDTHHRAVSEPDSVDRAVLEGFDAILAFGESLAAVYRKWGARVFVWHEAADVSHFFPRRCSGKEAPSGDVVWIGNWGDEERTEELETFLFSPVAAEELALMVHGVRYPEAAVRRLNNIGASYGGWVANADVPNLFARFLMTVHVPRRFYVEALPGIPTIRMFEALACGIPLISAWWPDTEGLFRPGDDHLVARTGDEMRRHMRDLRHQPGLREALATNGLETIRTRHTCDHRAAELMDVVQEMTQSAAERVVG